MLIIKYTKAFLKCQVVSFFVHIDYIYKYPILKIQPYNLLSLALNSDSLARKSDSPIISYE